MLGGDLLEEEGPPLCELQPQREAGDPQPEPDGGDGRMAAKEGKAVILTVIYEGWIAH